MCRSTYCCDFFLCNKVRNIKLSCNLEKWTLGRINLHSFNNVLSRFSGTAKLYKNLKLTNYCASINIKLAFFTIFVLTLQTGFATRWCFWFLKMTLLLNKFAHPRFILCVKTHEWKRSIAANKMHFLQPKLLLKVRICVEPPCRLFA